MGRVKCSAALCIEAPLPFSAIARAGSRRDYLNAPLYYCSTMYNASTQRSLRLETGIDIAPSTRSNVLVQLVVITRAMDYCDHTGGLDLIADAS